MPQVIEVPGYGEVEFPDDMDDEAIVAAIQRTAPPPTNAPPAPQRSVGQELGRQVGLTGRAVVTGLAGLPLAAAEGGAGIGNLISRGFGGQGSYSPTADFTALLNRYFPTPETGVEKGVQIVGSAVAGARIPGQQPVPTRAPTRADAAIREGVARHVPVYYDDVGGAVARKVGTAAESLGPLGTGSGRAVQAEAAKASARELVDSYAVAGDDVPVLIQKGMQARLAGLKRGASNLYQRVDRLLAPAGPVDVTAFKQRIAARIAQEKQLGTAADEATIATLERYLNVPAGDFAHMRAIRSALGDDISAYYTGKGAGAVGKRGADALQEAKVALDAAMAAHAKKTGGAGYDAWRKADAYYRQNIVPFKEAGFKDLAKTAEPEKVWKYLISGNVESRAVRMFNGLDRSGRNAVKHGLVKDALDSATDPKGNFSPARFAKYVEDHDSAINTFFRGADRRDIDGFVNLMRHVERAGQFAENPPTGNRLIPFLVGGAAAVKPSAAAAIAGTGLTIRALFQTASGRNLLMAAAKLKPGSPELQRVLEQTTRIAASASAAAQANDSGQ